MIVDIVDKYCTDDNNPIKNLRLKAVFIKMLMYRGGGVTRGATAYIQYKHSLKENLRESYRNRAANIPKRGVV